MQKIKDLEKQKMINYFKVHQLSLKKVFSKIFNKKIKNITYLGNYKLKKVLEYNFCVLKFNIVLENYSNYTVFVRLIEKNTIEENLYCYWLFCDENYKTNTRSDSKKVNIINCPCPNYDKKYEMQLFGKNKNIYKTSLLDIIDLKQKDNNKLLFIAII